MSLREKWERGAEKSYTVEVKVVVVEIITRIRICGSVSSCVSRGSTSRTNSSRSNSNASSCRRRTTSVRMKRKKTQWKSFERESLNLKQVMV